MALGAALGMNWLHQSKPKIIHRDLKLSNLVRPAPACPFCVVQCPLLTLCMYCAFICPTHSPQLIDSTYNVKVCDFGLTRIMDHDAPGMEGRPEGTPLCMHTNTHIRQSRA